MRAGASSAAVVVGPRVTGSDSAQQPFGIRTTSFLRIYCKIYGFIVWDSGEGGESCVHVCLVRV